MTLTGPTKREKKTNRKYTSKIKESRSAKGTSQEPV